MPDKRDVERNDRSARQNHGRESDKLLTEKNRLQEELAEQLTLNADTVTANVDLAKTHSSEIRLEISAEKKATEALADFPEHKSGHPRGLQIICRYHN